MPFPLEDHRPQGFRDFKLSDRFLDTYRDIQPRWGFGALSYVIFKRSYARTLKDGNTEEFWQTLARVVEGTYNIQKLHCAIHGLPFNNEKAQISAQRMYELMWSFKFLPPGRGLEHMGADHIYIRGGAALNNCGFVSTQDIKTHFSAPFTWTMDMLMLGVGVGFDTRGAGLITIQEPKRVKEPFVIPDSREGWYKTLEIVLSAYTGKGAIPIFDYSQIRPKGSPIKTFGGVSPGPKPLVELVSFLETLYGSYIGRKIDSTLIVDTMNYIGRCVVSGGRRRTSELALGAPDDIDFFDLKLDPEALSERRWASNNAVLAEIGMDYSRLAPKTAIYGDPGYQWLETSKAYGRLKDPKSCKDHRILGCNPCGEQSLESFELCNLTESFPAHHDSLSEYLETCKYAYLYAKTVALIGSHDPRTNAIQKRNMRIGLGQSGITQSFEKHGYREHMRWCDVTYKSIQNWDKIYSDWLCVPRSIKTTTVKPSGTISLLTGATPGIHYPQSLHYIRRVRIEDTSPLIPALADAGYPIELSLTEPNTFIVTFPVRATGITKTIQDITIWEQLLNAADMQYYWSDNQVSITVTFKKHEERDIAIALQRFEDRLKGVSFLPLFEIDEDPNKYAYQQIPYQPISEESYLKMIASVREINFGNVSGDTHEESEKFCTSETCLL